MSCGETLTFYFQRGINYYDIVRFSICYHDLLECVAPNTVHRFQSYCAIPPRHLTSDVDDICKDYLTACQDRLDKAIKKVPPGSLYRK